MHCQKEELLKKCWIFLKKYLKKNFKYHQPEQSFLEGVISRGDRKTGKLILEAYKIGARLDSWKEFFNLNIWKEAEEKLGIDMNYYLRERKEEEKLPWDHIDLRVSKEFLLKERWKAYREKITKDCRFEKCHKCVVCRKEIKNVLFYEKNIMRSKNLNKNGEKKEVWYEVIYCKKGKSVFLSQLEVIRLFILTLRKLGIPLSYTSGFNPHPRIITGDALPVGVFSEKEHLAFASTQSGLAGVLNGVEIYKGLKILKDFKKEVNI